MLIWLYACSFFATGIVPEEQTVSSNSNDELSVSNSQEKVPSVRNVDVEIASGTPDATVDDTGEVVENLDIKVWPLPNERHRKELTVAYLEAHSHGFVKTGDIEKDSRMIPRVITLHWTAGPSKESTHRYFSSATLSGRKVLKRAGALNVGSQFLVDRNGDIYRLVDETRIVRHVIGMNHVSIGVENVGGGDKWPLTPDQIDANIKLVRYLTEKYPITHLIGHFEYRGMEGHPYFDEKDPNYRTRKSDPGPDFMKAVRAGVSDLGLMGAD